MTPSLLGNGRHALSDKLRNMGGSRGEAEGTEDTPWKITNCYRFLKTLVRTDHLEEQSDPQGGN